MTVGVLLLTQADCALCEHAKGVLNRVARDFPLEIRVLDLGTEEGASLAAAVGMAFPPGVVIDGVAFSHGRLSERRLRRELTRRAKIAPSSPVAGPPLATSADPEAPEPELSRDERRAERTRLREVRRERRRQSMARKKDRNNNKKDNMKEMKGKR